MRRKLSRHGNILAFAVLGVLAAGGVGFAAIPAADGEIKGCYATTSGILLGTPHSKGDTRIVDSGEACRNYEKTIAWSQKGPKGDKGDQGLKGDACLPTDPACVGPKGDKGDACLPTEPACVGPKGDTGADGKEGPKGDQGPAGGVSDVYIARDTVLRSGEPLSKTVPAGSYAIQAKATLSNQDDDPQTATCRLSTGDQSGVRLEEYPSIGHEEAVALLDAATFAAETKISITCDGFFVQPFDVVLSAIKVGAVR